VLLPLEYKSSLNPLNAELNPIYHFLVLLGAHHILHISRIRVKVLFYAEDGGSKFLQNFSINHTTATV
jgi:hypothetical protein